MQNIHSEQVRNLWHKFFVLEENFLDWLNRNTEAINSNEPNMLLSYEKIDGAKTKPPKAFRHVCYLVNADDSAELDERINALKSAYMLPVMTEAEENNLEKEEVEKLIGKYPSRFPEFYTGVRQVNLSVTPAYSSSKISIGEDQRLLLKTYRADNSNHFNSLKAVAEEEQKLLIRFGLKTATLNAKPLARTIKLLISSDELIKLSNTKSLQLRKSTGYQYRARVFKVNGDMLPVRFGLMIFDTKVSAYNVVPQTKRSHALENAGYEFDIPISNCAFRVWIKQ